jgi:uncharacterized protein (TIGR02145 family)
LDGVSYKDSTDSARIKTAFVTNGLKTVKVKVLDVDGVVSQPDSFVVTVLSVVAPSITTQPQPQNVTAGQSVTFSVIATGTAPLTYQWLLNGTAISGATSSSYTIPNVQAANAGTYAVTVSNGTLPNATSNGALLTVSAAPVAPLIVSATVGDSSVTLTWNSVNGATSYNLYYAKGTTVPTGTETKVTGVISPKQITGLINGTQYAFAVTAVNAAGESVLSVVMTATPNIVDIDGNVYHAVTIGAQVWMVENLKTTRYTDGTPISFAKDDASWGAFSTANASGYCWYSHDSAKYGSTYGALYNWYAVNTGKLAPTGWHVPTAAEWNTLTTFIGGTAGAGGILKETGTTHWTGPNAGATNMFGFTALPGGGCYYYGVSISLGQLAEFWSSTATDAASADYQNLFYNQALTLLTPVAKGSGMSVRCIKGP